MNAMECHHIREVGVKTMYKEKVQQYAEVILMTFRVKENLK